MAGLESLSPGVAGILFGPRVAKQAKRSKPSPVPLTDEEQRGLLQKAGDAGRSALGAIGNLLDLPGSVVRDAVTLQNPLDQFLTPTSGVNRATGSEVLQGLGLAGRRDSFGKTAAGFGVELLTDPLTYMTLGGSALTKAGKVAKAAGLIDQAPLAAAKRKGVAAGSVGPREARVTTTLGELTQQSPKALEAARVASGGSLDGLVNQPLGGLVGFGLPFKGPSFVLGTGPMGHKVARGLDAFGSAMKFAKIPGTEFQPVNTLARLFDPKLRGAETPVGQALAKQHFRGVKDVSVDVDSEVVELGQRLQDAGLSDAASGDRLREVLEGVRSVDELPDGAKGVIDAMRSRLDTMPDEARRWGVDLERLTDRDAGYFPRSIPGDVVGVADKSPFSARDWGRIGREDFLRDIPGGTVGIKRLVADEDVGRLIDQGASPVEVEQMLKAKYPQVTDTFRTMESGQWVERPGRFQALAGFVLGLSPELRRVGAFARHPLEDFRQRLLTAGRAIEGAKAFSLAVTQPGIVRKARRAEDVTVGDIAKRVGLRLDSELGDEIARAAGVSLDEVAGFGIPKSLAEDLEGAVRFMTEPRELRGFVRALDDFTNLWRGSVTLPFLGYHARNLVNGQVHNALLGMFSPRSVRHAHAMMMGQVVAGASEIPAVKQAWSKSGGGDLDDRTATDILGRLMASHGVIGSVGEPFSTVGRTRGDLSGMLPRVIDDALRPGRKSVSVREIGRKVVGRGEDVSWRPWDVRGVGGRTQSRFAPVAAGEDVARYGEGLNRIAPFLHLLRRGVDPAEAARRVGAAQALYGRQDVTPFVADVVSRVFPFAKFTLGTAPAIVRELLERPGGPLGQAFRLGADSSEAANERLASEGVRSGTSVRLQAPIFDQIFGPMPEGSDRYLSNLGLVHEDLLGFADPARELGGRLNPVLRGPLEMATGKALHSGGRIEDARPTLGRLIGNLTGQERDVPIPKSLEHLLGLSPASRAASTALKLSEGTPESIIDALLGLKVSTATPAMKGRVAGLLLPSIPGADAFEGRSAVGSGSDLEAAEALLRAIDRRAKKVEM